MIPLSKSWVKDIRALQSKKGRVEAGLFTVETPKAVRSFLEAGWKPQWVVAQPSWWTNSQESHAVAVQKAMGMEATQDQMREISSLETPQEVLMAFPLPPVPESLIVPDGLWLALDDVRDPGNVGTILRLADWYGIPTVWVSEQSADAFQPKVVQASMGSLARVRVVRVPLVSALSEASLQGAMCLATEMEGSDCRTFSWPSRACMVMGHEGSGISEEVHRMCQQTLSIPRFSTTGPESLNVAIATGILLHEARRSR